MANPRKKQPKSDTNPNEENTVSDTEVTPEEEAPEAIEAPAEAPRAPKEPKPEIDHESNLYNAILAFGTDKNVEALQASYREVPSPSRGRVQGIAMKRAMQEANFGMDVLGEVLDAFNSLPAATKVTRTRPSVDEPTAARIRLAGLIVAYEQVRTELGALADEAHAEAFAWSQSGVPEQYKEAIDRVAANVVKASAKSGRGGSGTRTTMSEKLPDLLARGALQAGQMLVGANDAKATITADGKVETNGEVYENLSAAARVHRPSKKEAGKQTSTNGWDFWTVDGKTTVGSLRQS